MTRGQAEAGRTGGKTLPRSLAIIMDGNGRWARSRGFMRVRGHEAGVRAVRETVTECARLGLEALTLYAFSEENWKRPPEEIRFLMRMLKKFLVKERGTLTKNNVRLTHAGRIHRLPQDVLEVLRETEERTRDNDGLTLCLALSYGGRQELVDAMRALAVEVAEGSLKPQDIDEQSIRSRLYCPEIPDPDLVIRTASEFRISNFLLWQISYSEIYVTPLRWPEFDKEELHAAFADYAGRVRRFGGIPQDEREVASVAAPKDEPKP
ncbi:MAG TPA: di-trans,poly-cis-decaprenylcistransferase [Planctomycetes bacterium]|nr:di-trans,poly-cis-decaprenylcistransferase [Planctomycetota bacterium]